MAQIKRLETTPKLSRVVVHGETVYLSGLTAEDKSPPTCAQCRQIFARADALLASAGSDRSKLLLVQIYLRDCADFDEMNRAWLEWLDGIAPPARITVGARFALPEIAVEIQITAAARTDGTV
jgi:enamine deaminase RidA (YjgF/YER057c/UK114 family)